MNNDLISRSALIACIGDVGNDLEDDTTFLTMGQACAIAHKSIVDMVKAAPAVDAMVIPCKIGDTVWAIRPTRGGHLCAMKGVVSEMQFVGSEMSLSITIRGRCRGEWGKTVFATREEAEAEIARKRG